MGASGSSAGDDSHEPVDTADDSSDPPASASASTESGEGRSRDVVVPLRLYKTVTVFSTLFAIVFVLGGFVLIDAATDRATADVSEIDPLLAIVGVAGIVGGATIYAFSTRFRAEGMGKPKDESDEPSNNG